MGVSFACGPRWMEPLFHGIQPGLGKLWGAAGEGSPRGRRQVRADPLAFTLNRKGRPSNLLPCLSPSEWQIEGHTRFGRTWVALCADAELDRCNIFCGTFKDGPFNCLAPACVLPAPLAPRQCRARYFPLKKAGGSACWTFRWRSACLRAHGSARTRLCAGCWGSGSRRLPGLGWTPVQMVTNSPLLSLHRSLKVWVKIIASCVDLLLFQAEEMWHCLPIKFVRNVPLITLHWSRNAIHSSAESRLTQSWHNEISLWLISDVCINNQHHFLINYMLCTSIWLKLNFSDFFFKWDSTLYKLAPKTFCVFFPSTPCGHAFREL